MSLDLSRFHATFFAESIEGLNHVEEALLGIEQSGHDKDALDSIFRAIHSMKGSAGSLGFGVIAELAHEMESVLDRLRQALMPVSADSTNVLLRGVDCLRNWIFAAEAKGPVDATAGVGLVRELQLLLQRAVTSETAGAPAGVAAVVGGKHKYVIVFRPAQDFFHSGNDPARFIDELAQLGEINSTVDLSSLPGIESFVPTTCYLAWRITLETESSANDIREVFEWVSNCCALEIEEVMQVEPSAGEKNAEGAARGDVAAAGAAGGESRRDASLVTMHVRTDKIDELVNLVGELVITHTMLRQSTQGLDAIKDARAVSVFAQLERNVQDIQERVLSIRMMPVNHVFVNSRRLRRQPQRRGPHKGNEPSQSPHPPVPPRNRNPRQRRDRHQQRRIPDPGQYRRSGRIVVPLHPLRRLPLGLMMVPLMTRMPLVNFIPLRRQNPRHNEEILKRKQHRPRHRARHQRRAHQLLKRLHTPTSGRGNRWRDAYRASRCGPRKASRTPHNKAQSTQTQEPQSPAAAPPAEAFSTRVWK